MIDELTEKQQQRLIEFRQEWLDIGLSTQRTDRETTNKVLSFFYKQTNNTQPYIWHVESPLTANIIINLLSATDQSKLGANLRDKLGDKLGVNLCVKLGVNLGENLRANLRVNLGDKLWGNLGVNLEENLRDNLRVNLGDNLWGNLGVNLEENLRDNLRVNLGDKLGNLGDKLGNLGDKLMVNLMDELMVNLMDELMDDLWGNLRVNLAANLRDNLGDDLAANLRGNLRDDLRDNLAAKLRGNLAAKLRGNLRDDLRDNLMDDLRDNFKYIHTHLWGSLDTYWIAFYLFPHQELKPIHTKKQMVLLNAWADLAKSCFWWYPYKNICFVSDRPLEIRRDENGLLHSERNAAVEFIDGWKTYAWHGTNIPAQWIEQPELITPEIALTHENIEQRRCACEILGWDKVIDRVVHKILDINSNEMIGTLLDVNLPDVGKQNFLKFKCPTGRTFAQMVPDDVRTAQEAQNWIWQTDNYQPIMET